MAELWQQPLYDGARANLGANVSPVPSNTEGMQVNQQAINKIAPTLDGIAEEYFKIKDFGEQQKMEAFLRENQMRLDDAMEQAASIAPGADGSLFDADGTLRTDVVEGIVGEHVQNVYMLPLNFAREERQIEANMTRQANAESLRQRAIGKLAVMELKQQRAYFDNNQQIALQMEDWDGAIRGVQESVARGMLSPSEGDARINDILNKRSWADATTLLQNNPWQLQDNLFRDTYGYTLTTQQKLQLEKGLRNQVQKAENQRIKTALQYQKEAEKHGFDQEKMAKMKESQDPQNINEDFFTGRQVSIKANDLITRVNATNYKAVESDIKAYFVEKANNFNPNTSEDKGETFDDWANNYKEEGLAFGLPSEWLDKQIDQARKTADNFQKRINLEEILPADGEEMFSQNVLTSNLLKSGVYTKNPEGLTNIKKALNDDEWDSSARKNPNSLRYKYEMLKGTGIQASDDWLTAALKAIKYERNKMTSGNKNEVVRRFNAWFTTEEGKKASTLEQCNKLRDLTIEVTGDPHIWEKTKGKTSATLNKTQNAVESQRNKYESFLQQEKEGATEYTKYRQELPYMQVTYDKDDSLPAGVLLPKNCKGMKLDPNKSYVEFKYNDRIGRFPIVGYTDDDTTKLTWQAARGQTDDPNTTTYSMNKITIINGNKERDLEEYQRAIMGGRKISGTMGTPDFSQANLGGLEGLRDVFIRAGQEYGIDPALLASISGHETGWGTSNAFRNKGNAMGISNSKGVVAYNDPVGSVMHMAKVIATSSAYKDFRRTGDLKDLAKVYAPIGAENDPRGLNKDWYLGVSNNYKKLTGKDWA
jgi:hypothetical protein